ncbi:MAG: type II/IV secretion system ATPase subunit [Candidatus Bathyarchaeota archaeon]|nr:type II/IV secretion system ATPase subunit [Candidatus Bathyarchaeota archaeon]
MGLKKQKNAAEQESRPMFSLELFKRPKKQCAPQSNSKSSSSTLKETYDSQFRDFYTVTPPFGNVGIQSDKTSGRLLYRVIEPAMTTCEQDTLAKLKKMLREETNISLSELKDETRLDAHLMAEAKKIIKRFKLDVTSKSLDKFDYFIKRDFLGYGPIDVLIRDPNIEDISCNGTGIPVYVWHRLYESLPSNVQFDTRAELDAFITRLAYRSGHQISISNPILEGALPEGFRIHVTLEEVSKRGGTFTIRKVRANPFNIIDLINLGTMPTLIGAYFWILVENKRSIIASGATASGKTALLNSICTFIPPEMKVVTIEEVRELRLHENWIPMVTRPSVQSGIKEVTLFDLLKSSLRQRPDYIIVGEIRGEEAFTLFQSISVGHGGMCTIHAEDVPAVKKRLLTKPMDIPPMLIPMMNVVAQLNRTKFHDKIVRRITEVSEIDENGEFKKLFEWDPRDDTINLAVSNIKESLVLDRIANAKHISIEQVVEDLKKRDLILKWMVQNQISSYEEVASLIRKYYVTPKDIFNQVRFGA